jgi:hypothetical protein
MESHADLGDLVVAIGRPIDPRDRLGVSMAETTQPLPTLTCRHLDLTPSQLATLKPLQRLAAENTCRRPRPLADFRRQYARIHAQQLDKTRR